MKIKRIKRLKVNSYTFDVKWDSSTHEGGLDFNTLQIMIGTDYNTEEGIFNVICHELWEIAAIEMNVRLDRPDCIGDYIFVYDHRQHSTMSNMFAGLVSQFID